MTIVEKRGFAGGYKKGCACDVSVTIYLFIGFKYNLIKFHRRYMLCGDQPISQLAHVTGNHLPNVNLIMALVFRLAEN